MLTEQERSFFERVKKESSRSLEGDESLRKIEQKLYNFEAFKLYLEKIRKEKEEKIRKKEVVIPINSVKIPPDLQVNLASIQVYLWQRKRFFGWNNDNFRPIFPSLSPDNLKRLVK